MIGLIVKVILLEVRETNRAKVAMLILVLVIIKTLVTITW